MTLLNHTALSAAVKALATHVAKLTKLREERDKLNKPYQQLSEMCQAVSARTTELRRSGMGHQEATDAVSAQQAEVDAFALKHAATMDSAQSLGHELSREAARLPSLRQEIAYAELVGEAGKAYEDLCRTFLAGYIEFVARCQVVDLLRSPESSRPPMLPSMPTRIEVHAPINEPAFQKMRVVHDLSARIDARAKELHEGLIAQSHGFGC